MLRRRRQARLIGVLAGLSLALLVIAVLYEPTTDSVTWDQAGQSGQTGAIGEHAGQADGELGIESEGGDRTPLKIGETDSLATVAVEVVSWPHYDPIPHAELLVERPLDGNLQWRRVERDGRAWLEFPDRLESVSIRVRASGFAEGRAIIRLDEEHTVERVILRPIEGYTGRVTTTLGDPVARAKLTVWRSWPARPAFVTPESDEHGTSSVPHLAVLPARSKLLAELTTDAVGYYHIKPFDEQHVVDLVVAMVGSRDATAPMTVPMPHPGETLPVLVERAASPLVGEVVDQRGNPVVGVTLELDLSPGALRSVMSTTRTDGKGRFRFERHLGQMHLRVQAPEHELVEASDGGLALPLVPSKEPRRSIVETAGMLIDPQPPWIRLDLLTDAVLIELVGKRHISGRVTSGSTGYSIRNALVTVSAMTGQATWEPVAVTRISSGSRFHVAVSSADSQRQLRLSVRNVHHEPVDFDVAPTVHRDDVSHPVRMVSAARQDHLSLELSSFGSWVRGAHAELYAWDVEATGTLLDADGVFQVPSDQPPYWTLDTRSEGSSRGRPSSRARLPLPPGGRSRLAVLARLTHEGDAGLVSVTLWQPELFDPRWTAITLYFDPNADVWVRVIGKLEDRQLQLRRTTWLPWFDEELVHEQELREIEWRGVSRVEKVGLSRPSWSRIELIERRDPVDVAFADTGEFEVTREVEFEQTTLYLPDNNLVLGRVVFHARGDWPDLAVALCGPATNLRREAALGQTSWWTRASEGYGGFRFDAVPDGAYTFLLYRSLDDKRIEVLAQRSVTVTSDLFNLDIWEEPKTSVLRQFVQAN